MITNLRQISADLRPTAAAADDSSHKVSGAQMRPRRWRRTALVAIGALATVAVALYVTYARNLQAINAALSQYTAEHTRGARLISFDTGGHLLLGHQADLRAEINAFLRNLPSH